MLNEKLYCNLMDRIGESIGRALRESFGLSQDGEEPVFNFDADEKDLTFRDEYEISRLKKKKAGNLDRLADFYASQMESIRKWGAGRGIYDMGRLTSYVLKNNQEVRDFNTIAQTFGVTMDALHDSIKNKDALYDRIIGMKGRQIEREYDFSGILRQQYEDACRVIGKYRNADLTSLSYHELGDIWHDVRNSMGHERHEQIRLLDDVNSRRFGENRFLAEFLRYVEMLMDRKMNDGEDAFGNMGGNQLIRILAKRNMDGFIMRKGYKTDDLNLENSDYRSIYRNYEMQNDELRNGYGFGFRQALETMGKMDDGELASAMEEVDGLPAEELLRDTDAVLSKARMAAENAFMDRYGVRDEIIRNAYRRSFDRHVERNMNLGSGFRNGFNDAVVLLSGMDAARRRGILDDVGDDIMK